MQKGREQFGLVGFGIVLFLVGCATTPTAFPPVTGIRVVSDSVVTVEGGGGSVDIPFTGSAGQSVLIVMQSQSQSFEPYGYLSFPDGNGMYTPDAGNSSNGTNSSKVLLQSDGDYLLTVFDGANEGGAVRVRIELTNDASD